MQRVYGKSTALLARGNTYCPGCSHSTLVKLIAEVLEEQGWRERAITVQCIGCGMNTQAVCDWDFVQSPHGRAAAVATGVKRMQPGALVMTYQGDGDAACIGLAETYHAASRGEGFTAIMVNNQIYGMTGGQSSPTTLVGQKTTTSGARGRDPMSQGYPTKMCEMMSLVDAAGYVARGALHTPKHVLDAKGMLKTAFQLQIEQGSYSFLEFLGMCPTNWHIEPKSCVSYMDERVLPVFPVGVFKSPGGKREV